MAVLPANAAFAVEGPHNLEATSGVIRIEVDAVLCKSLKRGHSSKKTATI